MGVGIVRQRILLTGLILAVSFQAAHGLEPDGRCEVPSFEAISRIHPPPKTKRLFLQQPCDYKIIEARPDFKFLIKNATSGPSFAQGYGFVLIREGKPESFDFRKTEQRLTGQGLPLLTQRLVQDGCTFEQTSFTTEDAADRRMLMVRLRITPESDRPSKPLTLAWLTVGAAYAEYCSHPNDDYVVFEPSAPAWKSDLGLRYAEHAQHDGRFLYDVFRVSDNVSIASGAAGREGLKVSVGFERRKEAVIEVAIPYEGRWETADGRVLPLGWREEKAFSLSEKAKLARLSWDAEFARQVAQWEQQLKRATTIQVPEAIVRDIYRTLTLGNLQFLGSTPGAAYYKPGQGGFNNFAVVYGWESSHLLKVMDSQGFGEPVRRVLDYFLTTQQGVHGPAGDVSTAEGCFRPHIFWMCETGAILSIFAHHALVARDWEGLRRDSPALLKAARWIQGQRTRTKQTAADGTKVLQYGLMPAGRATDWPESGFILFTDAYTWQGLDRLAQAYQAAGLPEAAWLRQEADDYRDCILEAVRRTRKPHPLDPALLRVPSDINEDPVKAEADRTKLPLAWSLVDAGVLDPNHASVPAIEASMRRSGYMSDPFGLRMRTMEDAGLAEIQERSAGGKVDLYYVTLLERVWHRVWLQRSERLKALRYFYATLAYAVSRDVHATHERYCPQLPWLLPWQPNASGNGRVLAMILDTLCLEDRAGLHLLYGVPDAWFATKQPLGVTGLHTSWGVFSFQLTPGDKPGTYELQYESDGDLPSRLLVAIPSGRGPETRRIVEVSCKDRRKGRCLLE